MADFRLEAQTRTEFGKGSARRTRREGRVPGVLYGHGQEVVHLSVPAREFAAALRNGGTNVLLTIVLDGKEQLALTKAIQRDPITRIHEHVDLLLVRRGEKTTVDVPVVIVGEPAPDTISNHQLNTVSLEADATNLPESIVVDITGRTAWNGVTAGAISLEYWASADTLLNSSKPASSYFGGVSKASTYGLGWTTYISGGGWRFQITSGGTTYSANSPATIVEVLGFGNLEAGQLAVLISHELHGGREV